MDCNHHYSNQPYQPSENIDPNDPNFYVAFDKLSLDSPYDKAINGIAQQFFGSAQDYHSSATGQNPGAHPSPGSTEEQYAHPMMCMHPPSPGHFHGHQQFGAPYQGLMQQHGVSMLPQSPSHQGDFMPPHPHVAADPSPAHGQQPMGGHPSPGYHGEQFAHPMMSMHPPSPGHFHGHQQFGASHQGLMQQHGVSMLPQSPSHQGDFMPPHPHAAAYPSPVHGQQPMGAHPSPGYHGEQYAHPAMYMYPPSPAQFHSHEQFGASHQGMMQHSSSMLPQPPNQHGGLKPPIPPSHQSHSATKKTPNPAKGKKKKPKVLKDVTNQQQQVSSTNNGVKQNQGAYQAVQTPAGKEESVAQVGQSLLNQPANSSSGNFKTPKAGGMLAALQQAGMNFDTPELTSEVTPYNQKKKRAKIDGKDAKFLPESGEATSSQIATPAASHATETLLSAGIGDIQKFINNCEKKFVHTFVPTGLLRLDMEKIRADRIEPDDEGFYVVHDNKDDSIRLYKLHEKDHDGWTYKRLVPVIGNGMFPMKGPTAAQFFKDFHDGKIEEESLSREVKNRSLQDFTDESFRSNSLDILTRAMNRRSAQKFLGAAFEKAARTTKLSQKERKKREREGEAARKSSQSEKTSSS